MDDVTQLDLVVLTYLKNRKFEVRLSAHPVLNQHNINAIASLRMQDARTAMLSAAKDRSGTVPWEELALRQARSGDSASTVATQVAAYNTTYVRIRSPTACICSDSTRPIRIRLQLSVAFSCLAPPHCFATFRMQSGRRPCAAR